jgi:hypothetical protein
VTFVNTSQALVSDRMRAGVALMRVGSGAPIEHQEADAIPPTEALRSELVDAGDARAARTPPTLISDK